MFFFEFGSAVFIIFGFKNGMLHCHEAPQRQKHDIEAQFIFSQMFHFTLECVTLPIPLNNLYPFNLFCNSILGLKMQFVFRRKEK